MRADQRTPYTFTPRDVQRDARERAQGWFLPGTGSKKGAR
jgi:hypothetical protein